MTKTKNNEYAYIERYPDPTARAAIEHIESARKKKRKRKACVFRQIKTTSFRWRCSVCGHEFWLADGPFKAKMRNCPNCKKRIIAEDREII